MLQVGSSDDPSTSPDYEIIARDLRQLADEAAAQDPSIKMWVNVLPEYTELICDKAHRAYEMWAWGTHVYVVGSCHSLVFHLTDSVQRVQEYMGAYLGSLQARRQTKLRTVS